MIFNTLAADADMEWVRIDSTIVRATHTPRAQKFSDGLQEQELGKIGRQFHYEDPRGM